MITELNGKIMAMKQQGNSYESKLKALLDKDAEIKNLNAENKGLIKEINQLEQENHNLSAQRTK